METSPNLTPARMCTAWRLVLMDSMPPANTTLLSPVLIACKNGLLTLNLGFKVIYYDSHLQRFVLCHSDETKSVRTSLQTCIKFKGKNIISKVT